MSKLDVITTITPAGGGDPAGAIFKIRLIWEEEAGLLRGGFWEEKVPGEFFRYLSA